MRAKIFKQIIYLIALVLLGIFVISLSHEAADLLDRGIDYLSCRIDSSLTSPVPLKVVMDSINDQLTMKFIDHITKNLDRLWYVRFLLYGFYFTMLGVIISSALKDNADNDIVPSSLLLMTAGILGQTLFILQVIISHQIQLNYHVLELIFNNIEFVKKLSYIQYSIHTEGNYRFMTHPYMLALILIWIINIVFFGVGFYRIAIYDWKKLSSYICVFVTVFMLGMTFATVKTSLNAFDYMKIVRDRLNSEFFMEKDHPKLEDGKTMSNVTIGEFESDP